MCNFLWFSHSCFSCGITCTKRNMVMSRNEWTCSVRQLKSKSKYAPTAPHLSAQYFQNRHFESPLLHPAIVIFVVVLPEYFHWRGNTPLFAFDPETGVVGCGGGVYFWRQMYTFPIFIPPPTRRWPMSWLCLHRAVMKKEWDAWGLAIQPVVM